MKKSKIVLKALKENNKKKIDFSKYSTGKSLFKSSKEIDKYIKDLRKDRKY